MEGLPRSGWLNIPGRSGAMPAATAPGPTRCAMVGLGGRAQLKSANRDLTSPGANRALDRAGPAATSAGARHARDRRSPARTMPRAASCATSQTTPSAGGCWRQALRPCPAGVPSTNSSTSTVSIAASGSGGPQRPRQPPTNRRPCCPRLESVISTPVDDLGQARAPGRARQHRSAVGIRRHIAREAQPHPPAPRAAAGLPGTAAPLCSSIASVSGAEVERVDAHLPAHGERRRRSRASSRSPARHARCAPASGSTGWCRPRRSGRRDR